MICENNTGTKSRKFATVMVWLAVLSGLSLSVASYFKICSVACSETANYLVFGLDFSVFGMVFFTGLLLVMLLRLKYERLSWLTTVFLFASAGAEARFIWIQKYEIGQWCPVCLVIAASVYLACFADVWLRLNNHRTKGVVMKSRIVSVVLLVLFFVSGLGTAVLGVKKEADAAQLDLFLGKTSSPVTVYFISDWFCPACIRLEPVIDEMYPAVAKLARVSFVDFPIHKETVNFTPYNLQFQAFEKKKYISLRKALAGVAKKTKNPTDEMVQAAIKPLGVKLRTLSNSDVLYGMQANLMVYRGYDVNATPTVAITHSKTKKLRLLVGSQISEQAVRNAIKEVEAK